MTYALVDICCANYARPPRAVTIVLRPGKTPSGSEIHGYLRRLLRRIRTHWPDTRLTIGGDSHYGRAVVMAWCEANDVGYIFGLPGNSVLDRKVDAATDVVRGARLRHDVRVRHAERAAPVVRRYTEISYGAKSWNRERRVAARIEASAKGLDIRYVVTNIAGGNAENLIKLHKSQLASNRTCCRCPIANQVRLVLHTGAYWLMLKLRDAIPNASHWQTPRSPPCACACSRSQPASVRPPPACASRSPPGASRPSCPRASPAACNPPAPDHGATETRPYDE